MKKQPTKKQLRVQTQVRAGDKPTRLNPTQLSEQEIMGKLVNMYGDISKANSEMIRSIISNL